VVLASADRPATRLATRLAFLVAGFAIACWAPLVPFARERLVIDDAVLGMILLSLGIGSVFSMLLSGVVSARYGSKPVIVAGGAALTVLLPVLPIASTPFLLGLALFAFGAALGSLDVAMNVHAVEVERASGSPLMSGFHAHYSIGGFVGSSVMTFLLSTHLSARQATLACSIPLAVATVLAWPRLLTTSPTASGQLSLRPQGVVLLLATLAAITFLAEGAVLDWGALLITRAGLVSVARGGLGYMLFSIAMTVGRLSGDAIAARIGDRTLLFWGALFSVAGFLIVSASPIALITLMGFFLIGAGASNIVPILFRRAGTQRLMPVGIAVAAVTTAGYAGVLLGPAAVGFIAREAGLAKAFWVLAGLLSVVMVSARAATAKPA
jgi:predicted MFS family arabinose efflux permease